ncbi:conserved hypothetical protein [Lodderomyces elongisporus NRRL YB-4239]|uniref:Coatomer subunit delta n=1 Tax=Lodderomyces elongisporus (strain ATCC 11503 / CBS 2605 / JCM 1781 / NBRC 1676 / NRRL YB-4239) TaxID=379508 RepID=A5E3B9_LODEL|nr:conserved hypothetical protein [Lodderomyces elongisporus NRRL YB-4239]
MVVLAASICTRGGKALLSRQFRDISKDRITALLANFPSLISNSTSQHTSVEDENVRYVYQPLEEFYIVLITNKTSNILQDIDTLHLFASTISNILRNVDEREIFDNAFDIIDAFDEVINLGYKENLSLSQVQTFLEMDSHEEKIQEIIERNKELEATEERKRRAKEIQRKEMARQASGLGAGAGAGYNASFNQGMNYGMGNSTQSVQPTYQPSPTIETAGTEQPTKLSFSSRPRGGGLQLGKKPTKARSATSAAASSAGSANEPLLSTQQPVFHHAPSQQQQQQQQQQQYSTPVSKSGSPAPQASRVPNNGILVTINEKVNAKLTRDGSIKSSEVKGDLILRINDLALGNSKILLKFHDKADKKLFKIHPNVDRNKVHNENIITVKDKTKTFPTNDQATGVLKWRYLGKADDTSFIPILITAWVNIDDESSTASVTLEYELSAEFLEAHEANGEFKVENVKILVPVINHDIILQENDLVSYDILDQTGTVFTIANIDLQEPQGSFEFSVPLDNVDEGEDSLFPMELQFDINNTGLIEGDVSLGGVSITDVVSNDEEEKSLPFDLHSNVISDSYIVE